MKKTLFASAFMATLALGTSIADAAAIIYETRAITSGVNTSNYAASWAAQASAITSNSVATLNGTAPGNNSFAHVRIEFTVNPVTDILFQIAPDAGYGGALYLNGNLVDHDASDLWWGYNFNATSELLQSGNSGYAAANHVLEGYWAEGCCNGGQAGRFSLDNGATWQELSVSNLEALNNPAAVPEPGVLALFGMGLVGLAYARRRKSA
jgi:PEP-CTERM motif